MTKKNQPEIIVSKSGRKLAIIYRTAGVHFGTYTELREGRMTVTETQVRPYGFTGAARLDAIAAAASL